MARSPSCAGPIASTAARRNIGNLHRLAGQDLRIAGEAVQIDLPLGLAPMIVVELAALVVGQLEAGIAVPFQTMVEPRLQYIASLAKPEIGPRRHPRLLHGVH